MSRRFWCVMTATNVTGVSLIAACFTHNPNWPLNIPIGLAVGWLFGRASWPLVRWVNRQLKDAETDVAAVPVSAATQEEQA